MDDIRRTRERLATAPRTGVFRSLAVAATVAIVLLILARIAHRLLALRSSGPRRSSPPAAAIIGIPGLDHRHPPARPRIAHARRSRPACASPSPPRLSLSDKDDPWTALVVDTARQKAREVKVGQAIPLEAPRFWPVPLCAGLALFIVWITVPRMDLLGLSTSRQAAADREQEIIQARAEVSQAEARVREAMARAGINPDDQRGGSDPQMPEPGMRAPEDIRREAVRGLTSMMDQIRQAQTGERAQQLQHLEQQMRNLRQPGPGPLNEFTREMARGNFEAAQQRLEDLMRQLAQGDLTPEQRAQLEQQMRNLSQQLDQSANRDRIEQALMAAGDPSRHASSPSRWDRCRASRSSRRLRQMQNLSRSSASSHRWPWPCSSDPAVPEHGTVHEQMARPCPSPPRALTRAMSAMQQMLDELSQMQQMSDAMAASEAAMNEAMAQLMAMGGGACSAGDSKDKDRLMALSQQAGEWSAGETQGNQGAGNSGGPGQGDGGVGPDGGEDGQLERHRSPTRNTGQGPIIASTLVDGVGIRGDSVAEFQAVAAAASAAAAEALETRQVRREYHRAIQAYFGSLPRQSFQEPEQAP